MKLIVQFCSVKEEPGDIINKCLNKQVTMEDVCVDEMRSGSFVE